MNASTGYGKKKEIKITYQNAALGEVADGDSQRFLGLQSPLADCAEPEAIGR